MLSQKDKEQITKILQKKNKYIWTLPIILKVINIVEQLRERKLLKDDWFVQDILTYEDYLNELSIRQFIE